MDEAERAAERIVDNWYGDSDLIMAGRERTNLVLVIAAALRVERAAGRADGIEAAAHEVEARTRIPLTVIGSPEDVLQAELMADLSELVVRDIAAAIRKLGAHAP